MVLVFHHVIIFFLLSDWLIQILPPFWFCCDVACFCFGSETQLKCTYRRCCQFFKNIVLCLDVLSGGESASMATFFFMTLLLFSRMLRALHVHQRKTKHFIAKLFSQPFTLLHTFSILVNENLWQKKVPKVLFICAFALEDVIKKSRN